jgi:GMP reductase
MNVNSKKFEIGNTLHKLTIIEHINNDRLKVKCECGRVNTIDRRKFGTTKSCGCLKYTVSDMDNSSDIPNRQWSTYIYNAKQRGLEFNVTEAYAYGIYKSQSGLCALTGIPIEFKSKYSTASMDRIDSSLGYIEGNIQWVHVDINRIKLDLSPSYFQYLCERVANRAQSLNYNDVLIKPAPSNLTSRNEVNVISEFNIRGNIINSTGIVVANMGTTGTFKMAKQLAKHNCITALHKFHVYEDYLNEVDFLKNNKDNYFITIGENYNDLELLTKINSNITKIKMICIDVANAYRMKFLGFIREVRAKFPDAIIMAGNIATSAGAYNLITAGVDTVKIQIGPGSMCETRLKTGVGNGTLSTVLECSKIAHEMGAYVIADGGINVPSDAAKAFCAGSDMIMIGGMVAGTDEADGDIITKWFENPELQKYDNNGIYDYHRLEPIEKKYKVFYGMSSEYAQDKHGDGMNKYRSSEGRVEEVVYKGPVEPIIMDLLGGLRSTGTYIGATSIKNFGKCATFVRVNKIHDKF